MDYNVPPVAPSPKKDVAPFWLQAIVACMLIGLIAVIVFPVYWGSREASPHARSISNIKQIGLAAQMYAGDHDDRFPLTKTWEESLLEYCKNQDLFTDPLAQPGFTNKRGYAMNRSANAVSISSIKSPENSPLLFTSLLDKISAVGGKTTLRFHEQEVAIIGFADSSARRVSPVEAPTLNWAVSNRPKPKGGGL